jgi:DNA polymerase
MRTVIIQPGFDSWRTRARELLGQRMHPDELLWSDAAQEPGLFDPANETVSAGPVPTVPAAFLDLARRVAVHRDARRWDLLYRVLWRLTHGGQPNLLAIASDREVRQLHQWERAVGRDIHKMHAFLRFRQVGHDASTGREQFVAWFEPEHQIVRLAAGFFVRRFAGLDWSILTPQECAHWDGVALHYTPGVSRSVAPEGDALDDLWRTYYRSIFNPARLKVRAMQAEMPRKYWKNLPEARLIAGLVAESGDRVERMLQAPARPARPAPKNSYLRSLRELNEPPPAAGDAP